MTSIPVYHYIFISKSSSVRAFPLELGGRQPQSKKWAASATPRRPRRSVRSGAARARSRRSRRPRSPRASRSGRKPSPKMRRTSTRCSTVKAQPGHRASSGRAWRIWQLVTPSRSSTHRDAQPQPLPRLLELTFTAAGSTAFDHSGAAQGVCERAGEADGGQGGGDAAALAALERRAHRPPDQGRAHLLRR